MAVRRVRSLPSRKRRVLTDDPSSSPCPRANALQAREFEHLGNTLVPKRARIRPEDRRRHPEATRGSQAALRSPRFRARASVTRTRCRGSGAYAIRGCIPVSSFRIGVPGPVDSGSRELTGPGTPRCAGRPGEDRPGARAERLGDTNLTGLLTANAFGN